MEEKKGSAVLVGIQLPTESDADLKGSLQELTRLVETLGYPVIGQISQKRNSTRNAILLGEGKLMELARWTHGTGQVKAQFKRIKTKFELKKEKENENTTKELDEPAENDLGALDLEEQDLDPSQALSQPQDPASLVVVDCDLSPSQIRNLESATGVKVLDRTGVIIEIFSRHAKSRQSRLQVEIARLSYLAPRVRETGTPTERQAGRGAGETDIELDKRKIRDRLKELRLELESCHREQEVRSQKRAQEFTVALVGYTNAGKSSLMRALTHTPVYVENKLFATLDTTVRPLAPDRPPRILVSDTVGFIKKLPHDLVASFKSTLEEAKNASLLLHVLDASDPSYLDQKKVTEDVLEELGILDHPRWIIFNKQDLLTPELKQQTALQYPEALFTSALDKKQVQDLQSQIQNYFASQLEEFEVDIPYKTQGVIGEIHSKCRILEENFTDNGIYIKALGDPFDVQRIKKKIDQQK